MRKLINFGDRAPLKALQIQINANISEGRRVYGDKVENFFRYTKDREAWKG